MIYTSSSTSIDVNFGQGQQAFTPPAQQMGDFALTITVAGLWLGAILLCFKGNKNDR
jgi:hypothetical protein